MGTTPAGLRRVLHVVETDAVERDIAHDPVATADGHRLVATDHRVAGPWPPRIPTP